MRVTERLQADDTVARLVRLPQRSVVERPAEVLKGCTWTVRAEGLSTELTILEDRGVQGGCAVRRPMPFINEMNRYFWESGKTGQLNILRCLACGTWIHPFAAMCPKCRSREVQPRPVSGRGAVASFTINVQPWFPTPPTPYVIALVELEEQSNIRLVTNLPTCPIDDVKIGLPVGIYFEQHGNVYIPLFRRR